MHQIALDEFNRQLMTECKERGLFFKKLWRNYQLELLTIVSNLFSKVDGRYKSLNIKFQSTIDKMNQLDDENSLIRDKFATQNNIIEEQKGMIEA